MKAIINMTTAFLILLLFLFGFSLATYKLNPEKYQWLELNANGELVGFKDDNYDVEVSYNLETPLVDLNGYSLKEVFFDNNLIENYKPEEPVTSSQWYLKPTIQFDNGYFKWSLSTNLDFIIAENITINHNDDFYLNFNMYTENANGQIVFGGITGGSVFSNTPFAAYVQGIYSNIFTVKSSGNASRLDIRMTGNTGYVYTNNFYMISLTDLGIDQTKDEMDFWYNEYQRLQDNQIQNYKELGSTVEASWQFLTGYFTTIIDIIDAQVDVILNPLEALGDGLSIITVPIFGLFN